MSSEVTTNQVIEMIAEAGMNYHDFKCSAAANRHNTLPGNLWQDIAEMARTNCPEVDWLRAWELAGVAIPEDYLEAA